MVRGLAVIAMLSGCDGVFGLHELHLPTGSDAGIDSPPSKLEVAAQAHSHSSGPGSALVYPLTVPPGVDRVLLLYIALGSNCPPGALSLANVVTFGYAALPPTRLERVVGTPCSASASSSEVWMLVNPPVGTADVAFSLDTPVQSIHSAAIVLTGVDTAAPSRGCVSQYQVGDASIVTVPSAPGELVLSFIAQGKGIAAPGADSQLLYLENVNDFTTLNNSAASMLEGVTPDALATWNFIGTDQWQAIACSLRPAR
jgi:hypothetical protein